MRAYFLQVVLPSIWEELLHRLLSQSAGELPENSEELRRSFGLNVLMSAHLPVPTPLPRELLKTLRLESLSVEARSSTEA